MLGYEIVQASSTPYTEILQNLWDKGLWKPSPHINLDLVKGMTPQLKQEIRHAMSSSRPPVKKREFCLN
jgi:hypothetical protein